MICLKFNVIIEKDKDGYFAYCPSLQGRYTQGDTFEEALDKIKDAVSLYLEDQKLDLKSIVPTDVFSIATVGVPI